MRFTLTPEDAAALGRVLEDGAERIVDGPQRDVAYAVAHKLIVSQGSVVIETDVREAGVVDTEGIVSETLAVVLDGLEVSSLKELHDLVEVGKAHAGLPVLRG